MSFYVITPNISHKMFFTTCKKSYVILKQKQQQLKHHQKMKSLINVFNIKLNYSDYAFPQ